MRRRNSLLEGIETLRRVYPEINVNNIVLFLYVCENEGLSLSELSKAAGYNMATTSRALRAMGEEDAPGTLGPRLGWIRLLTGIHRGSKAILLTTRGRDLRRQIDAIITEAVTIAM